MISKSEKSERGEGKIGAIIALLVVALMVHVSWEFIPFKIKTAEFEKHIEDDLLDLAANLKKDEEFLMSVAEKAKEMQLEVREEHLKLELVGATWKFQTEYEVTLKMIWGDWVQSVSIERERTKL